MTGAIVVRGIRAEGRHGMGAERDRPQPFVADVELRTDTVAAARADDLDHTVDYSRVARVVKEVITSRSFELLESLAEAVAAAVLELGGTGVRVRVSKPGAAASMGVDEVAVVVERSQRAGGSG